MAAPKAWGKKTVDYLRTRFRDANGVVVWKSGHFAGRVAGSLDDAGYRVICIQVAGVRHFLKAHRVMWALYHDTVPVALDHKDRNRDNNYIENLRPSNAQHNTLNKGKYANNKTGMSGVKLRESGNYQVQHRCKSYGTYPTYEQACEVKLGLIAQDNII